MKKIVFIFAFIFLNKLQASDFGVGAIVGEPTGITFEKYLEDKRSVDLDLAWSFGRHSGINIVSDYLVPFVTQHLIHSQAIGFYYGLGGRLIFVNSSTDSFQAGLRLPLGLRTDFGTSDRIENLKAIRVFAEIVPVLTLVPKTAFEFDFGFGFRFRF